jgi:hypothetical protein
MYRKIKKNPIIKEVQIYFSVPRIRWDERYKMEYENGFLGWAFIPDFSSRIRVDENTVFFAFSGQIIN